MSIESYSKREDGPKPSLPRDQILTCRLPRQTHQDFADFAKKHGTSMSTIVQTVIRKLTKGEMTWPLEVDVPRSKK